jgi:hypothetical protein
MRSTASRAPAPSLALAVAMAVAFASPARAFVTCYALAGGSGQIADALPQVNGPFPITGGVGSTGDVFAACDAGQLRAYGHASNPVSGLFTPQIDAMCRDMVDTDGVHYTGVPDSLVGYRNLVLHTFLTGKLAISGAHPYTASVGMYVSTWYMDGLYGNLELSRNGVTSSGLLAGAPLEMLEYAIDIPITTYLNNGDSDALTLYFETFAGGTALGTEVNTASAEFGGPGWHFATTGPVFDGLPPGVRIDIPSLHVVDNHWIGGSVASAPPAPASPTALALAALRNPARGRATFALTLPSSGPARVGVFDLAGRRMATLHDGWQAAGTRELAWDADGAHATAGVYFARVESAGRVAVTRIVLMP